jgi:hypothetical protein|tara:strand:- start:7 stop:201 length:195 start_codon:yes stop_codon:yes gene_type:complete
MPNYEFRKEKKFKTKNNKDSYIDTFRVGNKITKEDPFAPLKLGGTTNVIKRLLGFDYKKRKRNK